jgi:hypothetical protein
LAVGSWQLAVGSWQLARKQDNKIQRNKTKEKNTIIGNLIFMPIYFLHQ